MNIENMPKYMENVCVGDIIKFQERSEDLSPLCQKAIGLFGVDLQRAIAIEELSELVVELAKEIRGTGNRSNLIKELVDVDIMIAQLKEILFNEGHLEEYLDAFYEKMDHLEEIIENKEDEIAKDTFRRLFFDRRI